MKKRMILAASLMAAVALTSCSNNDFEDDVQTGSAQLVEIKVGQEVQGIETKAAISTGSTVEATIIASNGAAPTDWSKFPIVETNTFTDATTLWDAAKFANVSVGTFEAGVSKSISLNPALYANPATGAAGGATLTGVAPKGKVENGKVTFSVLDGQQDVMTAPTTEHSQAASVTATPFALTFSHKTAQLRFIMAAMNNNSTGAWTPATDVITVKKVTVKSAKLPSAVNLTDMSVVWGAAADISLNDLKTVIPMTFATQPNNTKADTVLVEKVALVKPGESVVLDVMVSINGKDNSYTNIKPTKVGGGTLTTAEAKYHNIRLTIKQPASATGIPVITATATVTEWGKGDEGEAIL